MNGSAPCQIHLVIVGATGMVGGYALRYALIHPSVGVVTVIGRSKLGISHPKLKEVLHQDFAVPILRSERNAVKRGERVRTRKSASPESIRTLFNSFCAPGILFSELACFLSLQARCLQANCGITQIGTERFSFRCTSSHFGRSSFERRRCGRDETF